MTPEPITITQTVSGLRSYPPLIFAWQKWPMRFERLLSIPGKCEIITTVFYERDGYVRQRRHTCILGRRLSVIHFDEYGPTNESLERFYRLAHLTLSGIAAGDPTIQAFAPEVGQE